MKRIFVGIPIKIELTFNFVQDLRQQSGVRWIKPKNLHVTLVPPWQAQESEISGVINQLRQIKARPFEMLFDLVGFGPNPKAPRLIWASGRASAELLDLKQAVEKTQSVRIKSDRTLYKLHLTLARFRFEDFQKFKEKNLHQAINWRCRADSFVLYESHLSSQGADYEILAEFSLRY